ncbi:MAG: hypothetical protein VX278_02930 [Myxococcota bacterium]|nr:hypothetical protein [Myxococcota bacterium]
MKESTLSENTTQTKIVQTLTSIEGIELSSLKRYMVALFILIVCLIVLLWSRLQLSKTRMELGKAQNTYEEALREHQRLELELNLLLSPAAIEQQINQLGLDPNVTVIDVSKKQDHN